MARPPVPAKPSLECHLAPAGAIVLALGGASLGYGLLALEPPLLLAGAALLATWGWVRRLARSHLEAISFERLLPRRTWTGRSFAVSCRAIGDLPDSAWGGLRFSDSLAPERKGQSLPHDGTPQRYPARCARRGLLDAGTWQLESSWPLAWFTVLRRGRFAPGSGSGSLVLPAPSLPEAFSRELQARLAAREYGFRPGHDLTAEFRLLRDFRSGDSVRAVHWPTSLRHGGLLVRESEPPPPRSERFGVLMHSCGLKGGATLETPESFEALLRLASGLLQRLRQDGIEVLWICFPDPPRLLRRDADFVTALDRLALLSRPTSRSLDGLAEAARPLAECEERFVLADTPRASWEPTVHESIGTAHWLDLRSYSPAPRLLRSSA